jgi:hypothetical protein
VRDLRRAAETKAGYPPILFIYQGTAEDGTPFFARLWPTARAIADPDHQLYHAFGIERGTSDQFMNPSIIACGIRATLKGNFNGRIQGDARLMPGLFLVANDTILWHHDYRNPGDHPNFATLPTLLATLTPAN